MLLSEPRTCRILHVIDHLGVGGAQTFLLSLLANWPNRDDEIHLIGLGRKRRLEQAFRDLPHIRLRPSPKARFDVHNVFEARRLMRTGGFDIIHCHLPKAVSLGLVTGISPHTRLVIHEHGDPALRGWPFRIVMRLRRNHPDLAIAVAHVVAQRLHTYGGIPSQRIVVVPNGIVLRDFHACAPPLAERRAALGIPDNANVIGFVGRLAEQKGVRYLLDALAQMYPHRPNIAAIIVGDGPLRPSLEDYARRKGIAEIVRFVGYQYDVPAWLPLFDVGVVPSLWEPFGLVAIECMAAGVPVVATAIGGLKENIEDGKTGLLVPPKDVVALSKAIEQLLDCPELCRTLIREAGVFVEEHYVIETTASRIRQLYVDLLSHDPSRQWT